MHIIVFVDLLFYLILLERSFDIEGAGMVESIPWNSYPLVFMLLFYVVIVGHVVINVASDHLNIYLFTNYIVLLMQQFSGC